MGAGTVNESQRALAMLIFDLRVTQRIACIALVGTTSIDEKLLLATQIWSVARALVTLDGRFSRLTPMRMLDVEKTVSARREQPATAPRLIEYSKQLMGHLNDHAYPILQSRLSEVQGDMQARGDIESVDSVVEAMAQLKDLPSEIRESSSGCECGDRFDVECEYVIPTRPGRPSGLGQAEPEARPTGLLAQLHDFAFRIELCAAEVCAAMIAGSPSAPLSLHTDLALQLRDEARHFELFMEQVRLRGGDVSEFKIRFDVWDRFRVARTLPEQLLIEQRIGEGAALDSAEALYSRLIADGERELAGLFEYVTADEVQHVRNGNCWLLTLLGSEEQVLSAERDARELLQAHGLDEPIKPLSENLRQAAGFSREEINTIGGWR